MTTATPRKPRPRKLTVDETAAGLVTGEEYRRAHRAAVILAAFWWVCAVLVVLLLAVGTLHASRAVYAYTDTIRPRSAQLYRAMRDDPRPARWTAVTAADLVPVGWAGDTVKYLYQCAQKPGCLERVRSLGVHQWSTLPDLEMTRKSTAYLAGLLVFLSGMALLAQSDVKRWELWEIEYHRKAERQQRKLTRNAA